MPWKGLATPRYNKRRRKLTPEVLRVLNDVQIKLLEDPLTGDRKRGTLKDVWVEKFQAGNDQYLVAYEIAEKGKTVTFLDIGQHENFYRDLEKYKKATR